MVLMKFLHTMLRIKDLNQSLRFYTEILGLQETHRHSSNRGRFTLIYLATPHDIKNYTMPPTIELTYNWEPEHYVSGRNFGHIAFEVDDIYDYCQQLQSHNIAINRPPRDGKMAFIKSPDDISIELLQSGSEPLEIKAPWCDMPNIGVW
ncbi:MAG: lactoylglutathione lyase [Alphaproteobacteria bacterium]|jgi:lactoylglutathione lyase